MSLLSVSRAALGKKLQRHWSQIVVLILLISGSIIILLPIWWMISTSLKPMQEIMLYPPTFFPKDVQWANYVRAWTSPAAHFTRWLGNTALITVCVVCASILSNTFVAYGFAKIKFPGRGVLFSMVLATMMIPGFVTLIPQYILFANIGWMNSYLPLIVPSLFGSAFYIFLLRQFFMTIPGELIEAAKIDGANHFYIWAKLMLPLIKPAIAAIAIFSFNGAWNDFLGPLLYVNSEMMYTLQIGLQTFKGTESTQWHYLMAASLMVLLPVLALFVFFQKYFIEGMNLTAGTKG